MTYDPWLDQPPQPNGWACLPTSLAWAVESLGYSVERAEVGLEFLRSKIITPRGYLQDKTGTEIRDWSLDYLVGRELASIYQYDATFDEVAQEAGVYPVIIGSGTWLHYAAVRDYDPARDLLVLANSSPGWQRVHHTMSRVQFRGFRPVSLTRVAPTEVIGSLGENIEHNRRRGLERPVERPRAILVGARALPAVQGGAARGRGVLRKLRGSG